MPAPVIHTFPVRRPGFISAAVFEGSDDALNLNLTYPRTDGMGDTSFILRCCRNPDNDPDLAGHICLPSSKDINYLSQDALIAHIRMAALIAGVVPGSQEWMDSYQADLLGSTNLQTAIGNVKVTAFEAVDADLCRISVQKTSGGPVRVIDTDYGELGVYTYAPETQLHIVGGAIEKQFPSYVHNPAGGTTLSSSQKSAIVDYVLSLEPWI